MAKLKYFREGNNTGVCWTVCQNQFLRDMVDRLGVAQEANGASKVKAGRKPEIKQEITGSVIQALSEANRELSEREHDDILEEEVTRSVEPGFIGL